jgi:hypothetical protein
LRVVAACGAVAAGGSASVDSCRRPVGARAAPGAGVAQVDRRRAAPAVAVLLALVACATGPAGGDRLSSSDVEALRRSIALAGREGAAASATATVPGPADQERGGGAKPSAPEGGAQPGLPPPRSELERRARAVLGPTRVVGEISLAGDGSRYALVLGAAEGDPIDRLLLLDLATDPGLVVGEHDFAAGEAASGASGADPSSHDPTAAPEARFARPLEVMSDSGEPVLLAEIHRGNESIACGWWLRRRGTTFVCAPRATVSSSYRTVDGALVESWEAFLPEIGGDVRVSGKTGRLFGILGGRWREADHFRCLAWPLEDALRQAGPPGLDAWQRSAVRQRVAAARRESDALETGRAVALLNDALSIDGCDAVTWRLLGRLEFERGRAASAAPPLAVALALGGGEPATMVDLADALAVLNASPPSGAASLQATLTALEGHGTTREVVERARRETGTPSARGVSVALYETFLERTSPTDPRLEATRRRAAEQIAALRAARKPPARAKVPAKRTRAKRGAAESQATTR